jgi:hypothetical protein
MSAAEKEDTIRPRLYPAALTFKRYNLPFKGKNYDARMQISGYGDFVIRATDASMMLIEANDDAAASKYFGKVAKGVPELHHEDRNLTDNIKVF